MRRMFSKNQIETIAEQQSKKVKLYSHYVNIEYQTSEQGEIQYIDAIIPSTQKEKFTEITNDILLNATFIKALSNDNTEYCVIFVADDLELKAIYELNNVVYYTSLNLGETIIDFSDDVLA